MTYRLVSESRLECPYCFKDAREYNYNNLSDDYHLCRYCRHVFKYEVKIRRVFTSTRVSHLNENCEHVWEQDQSNLISCKECGKDVYQYEEKRSNAHQKCQR